MPKRTAATVNLEDLKPVPPKVLEARLSDEGLREIKLQLGKRKIVVSEADYFSDIRMGQAVNEMLDAPLPDPTVQGMMLTIYPPLMACSHGDLPTHSEAIRMGKEALNLWITTARQLNPGEEWFKGLDSIEKSLEQARAETPEDALKEEVEKKE